MKKFLSLVSFLMVFSLYAGEAVWQILDNLSQSEKENALIDIECEAAAETQANQAEEAWNNGNYEEAIELIQNSNLLDNAAVGVEWKKPVKTHLRWGGDVRIGSRDSISTVALDVDNSTGNLFAVLKHENNGHKYWCMNISDDIGETWTETFNWGAGVTDVDATVLGNYLYVAYSSTGSGRLRRFKTSDGDSDDEYGSKYVIYEASDVREIALAANNDSPMPNYLGYSAIMDNDSLKFYWSDTVATSWTSFHPDIGNASRGLDAASDFIDTLWISYVGTNDSIYVSRAYTSWKHYGGYLDYVGSSPYVSTSIGAYGDTVILTYPHYNADSANYEMKYMYSVTGGGVWGIVTLVGSSNKSFFTPDVTARNGDGIGLVYQTSALDGEGLFTHRNYTYLATWSPPYSFTDSVPRINVKPSIERIAEGLYGIVYVNNPEQIALFETSDNLSGIEENVNIPDENIISIKPSVFNSSTDIVYYLSNSRDNIALEIHDALGRKVKTLFEGRMPAGKHLLKWKGDDTDGNPVSNGIYFCVLKTENTKKTSKITLIR